ncbi:hypothetical protein JZ751_014177, partial [Albula glossodonta]
MTRFILTFPKKFPPQCFMKPYTRSCSPAHAGEKFLFDPLSITRLRLRTFSPQVSSFSCPFQCSCAQETPSCAPGVRLVPGGCGGCCKVCARQLNEDCSQSQPCDRTKGLECNFGASPSATKGICRAKSEGRPCEYNSRMYQNSETFQPNCKHLCTCRDGAVGCTSLCPQELPLPSPACFSPRLVKLPGRCCQQWVCHGHHHKAYGKAGVDRSENDLIKKKELIPLGEGHLKSLPAFRILTESRMFGRQRCIIRISGWSQCSKTCGPGISIRVTNNNAACRLMKETRICEVCPCLQSPAAQKVRRWSQTEKAPRPMRFRYSTCSSVQWFRPNYCGSCRDRRCSKPQLTRTVPVRFRCPGGRILVKKPHLCQYLLWSSWAQGIDGHVATPTPGPLLSSPGNNGLATIPTGSLCSSRSNGGFTAIPMVGSLLDPAKKQET